MIIYNIQDKNCYYILCYHNSIFLTISFLGDIILKEYNTEIDWPEKLTIRQLINWPTVQLEFKSKDLCFKRCNAHEFQRFLAYGNSKLPAKKTYESCIEEVDLIDINMARQCYSLNVIKEYCNLYIKVLKEKQKELVRVSTVIYMLFNVLFAEFIR